MVAVDPTKQGQGLASKVMRATSAIADQAGVKCYLDTMGSRRCAIYRRFGYQVVEEVAGFEHEWREQPGIPAEPWFAMARPAPKTLAKGGAP